MKKDKVRNTRSNARHTPFRFAPDEKYLRNV